MKECSQSPGELISRSTQADPENDFSPYMEELPRDSSHRGWHKPAKLPHFDAAKTYQLITYRLADSLPKTKLAQIELELKTVDPERIDAERRRKIEAWLDAGHGSCMLRHDPCAQIVVDAWQHFHGSRYRLIAWTVMPNHVHVLIQQMEGYRLSDIVASWKKYTARKINALVGSANGCSGEQPTRKTRHLWQRDYWDRFIRNQSHFEQAIDYILNNPVKAGLVTPPQDWPWSGAKLD